MVLSPRGWVAVGAWLSLILVPVFHYYWKRWDRPSKAAQEEMARRKHELEVKRAFELEDMKLRAEEAAQAKMELAQRKRTAPPPVDSEVLQDAWSQLGVQPMEEKEVTEPDEVDIPKIKEMLETLPEVEEEFVTPDSGPVLVELPKNTPIDEKPEQIEDEVEPAPDLDSWDETNW
tara:strand:+ start:252 stop:776 length:525 start_codon:yes stop_codon:yes gene_type:complete